MCRIPVLNVAHLRPKTACTNIYSYNTHHRYFIMPINGMPVCTKAGHEVLSYTSSQSMGPGTRLETWTTLYTHSPHDASTIVLYQCVSSYLRLNAPFAKTSTHALLSLDVRQFCNSNWSPTCVICISARLRMSSYRVGSYIGRVENLLQLLHKNSFRHHKGYASSGIHPAIRAPSAKIQGEG